LRPGRNEKRRGREPLDHRTMGKTGKLTDELLMSTFQKGSATALEELFLRYEKRLFSYLYNILGDKNRSADALHDTFLKIVAHKKDFRPPHKFSSWVYAIARNNAFNMLKRAARTKEIQASDMNAYVEATDTAENMLPLLEDEEAKLSVRNALDRLPLKYKEVLVMRFYHDLTYDEIAQALHTPKSTVKSRFDKALELLAKTVKNPQE